MKITGQVTPSWLAVGKLQANPEEWRNVYASPFVAPEATPSPAVASDALGVLRRLTV